MRAIDEEASNRIIDKVGPQLMGETFYDIAATLLSMSVAAARQSGIKKMELQFAMVKMWDGMDADPQCLANEQALGKERP